MRDFDAVIFDLDGVICYTDEYHYQAWKAMADSIGVSFDREINNRLRGVSRMASLDIVLEKYHGELSEAEKEELADQKNEIYKKLLAQMSPADLSDEVKSTLDELRRRGYPPRTRPSSSVKSGWASTSIPFRTATTSRAPSRIRRSLKRPRRCCGSVPSAASWSKTRFPAQRPRIKEA